MEEFEPLYTVDDTVPPADTSVNNYPIIKGVVATATGNTEIPDEFNFDQFVDANWRTTVPESNAIAEDIANQAAANGDVNTVEQIIQEVRQRNEMYGRESARMAEDVRAKIKELSQRAAENVVASNPAVLMNNPPEAIAATIDSTASQITAQALYEKAVKDGEKIGNLASGFLYEFTPFAAEQGAAIDRVAVKYGVPEDRISRLTGRSLTREYLRNVFNSLPEEKKGEWLSGLYNDLQESALISDWQAALLVQEVVAGETGSGWDGFSDWLDRLGVVATVVTGIGALGKGAKLWSAAGKAANASVSVAKVGGKEALVAAEAAKMNNALAQRLRLRAAGAVAGEVTGISTAIDLAKLVSLSATKVLPDTIVTAASDLQKTIREPVERLIADLQETIAGKGVRASEAAQELDDLRRVYSPANNPNIHSVDNFTLSSDATQITGKVYYKPADRSSFLTREAAENYIKVLDPSGTGGLRVVPDTTNTGFLVSEDVKKTLTLRRDALKAQILERAAEAERAKKAAKRAAKAKTTAGEGVGTTTTAKAPVEPSKPSVAKPASLDSSKPRYGLPGGAGQLKLGWDDDVDKAAYILSSKTAATKADPAIKEWLVATTGWTDEQIAAHAQKVRDYIKRQTKLVDVVESGALQVGRQRPLEDTVRTPSTSGMSPVAERQQVAIDSILKDGSITNYNGVYIQEGISNTLVLEFTNKLNKALNIKKPIIVLDRNTSTKSSNPYFNQLIKQFGKNTKGLYFPFENYHVIMMGNTLPAKATKKEIADYMAIFAHEYGHAFEFEYATKYSATVRSIFEGWLTSKNIKFTNTKGKFTIQDMLPFEALLEYRVIQSKAGLSTFIEKHFNGDIALYKNYEKQIHEWASSYREFFAENFAKWAFTDEVPTTILGKTFASIVKAFKQIGTTVAEIAARFGVSVPVQTADKQIAKLLNDHIAMLQAEAKASPMIEADLVQAAKELRPSVDALNDELLSVEAELKAIDDAEKGLVHGWLVEQPIKRDLGYEIIGKYEDSDINSASRFAMGDWTFATSTELYQQRLAGINQQSRYQKLLTEFVRKDVEKLNKKERIELDNALVLGDKEGKVFSEVELSGMGMNQRTRHAYYKVRALRDVMWQMRNDVAAKSLTKRGFVQVNAPVAFDDGLKKFFGKPIAAPIGKTVYDMDTLSPKVVSEKYLEEANQKGIIFYEAVEPIKAGGKERRLIAISRDTHDTQKIKEVIPYRAGEYRRIYSDEYFVKIEGGFDVDGAMESVVQTHRTASNINEAKAYVKAFNEALADFNAGRLTVARASALMEPFGWKPEDFIRALENNEFGQNPKLTVKFNRMDDDYVSETIGLSHSFGSKRGDRVLSVRGEDTVNTLSPLESIAAEIGNTAYVASVTEWRESSVIRWFNTFRDDLPANVQNMNADQAFMYMLNNKGMYMGSEKRLSVAEKVQDYIISQMNIPTKEEKLYMGFMRMISETFEQKFDSKAVTMTGAALRATTNFPIWLRTISFHSFFALNPVQFFMQGMNAFNAVAISPIHGLKSAKASVLYASALMSDQEEIWRKYAKMHKLSSLGLGMAEDEFVETVRAIRRVGLLDGMNTTSLYGAETGKYGLFNGLSRKAGNVSAAFFNAGEGYSRLVSFDIAKREFIEKNPGAAWWTDDNLVTILKRQDDLTQNMTRANTLWWQRGWASVPTQFIQYQAKLMMNIIQGLRGNSRGFSKSEAAQLLIMHTIVMGTAGAFLWPFRDMVTDLVPEDMSEEGKIAIQQGVVAGAIAALSEGEAKLALGSRFNTFAFYEDLVKGILDPEKNFLEVLAGPSGFAAFRILGGAGEALSIVAKAPMTMDTLQLALEEIGRTSFSTLNNMQKARIAMHNYNKVMSNSGGPMFQVTDTEAFLLAFGIPPAAQEDLSILYESRKAHRDDLTSAGKTIARHAMLAATALRANDRQRFETHRAVVQAIINTYDGADYKALMKEAYKDDTFTQYEKLLVDQMVNDWQIKDFITGVNK